MGFMNKLKTVASAKEAIEVIDAVWLVLIEMLGRDMVERHTAELAEHVGQGVKANLEAAGASEIVQIVATTVIEAGVSFSVMNGLCATMREADELLENTGLRGGQHSMLNVDLAVLETEMNRVLAVLCTPEVAVRLTLRMVPMLRLMIEHHAWMLEVPSPITLTLLRGCWRR